MIKADYIIDPSNDIRILSAANRIVSSNLIKNDKLDIYFNIINIYNFFDSIKEYTKMRKEIKKLDPTNRIIESERTWAKYAFLRTSNITFKRNILKYIKNDLVLFTSNSGEVDLEAISFLLQNNIRVVVGGSSLTIMSFEEFRNILRMHGCTENHLKNIILVSGYVTNKTDIHKIIEDWKDVMLGDWHVVDFFESTFSYFSSYQPQIKELCIKNNIDYAEQHLDHWTNYGGACLFFKSGCWYNKCSFCSYSKYDSRMNIYSSDKPPVYIAFKILELLNFKKIKNIFITDDYFVFNNKNKIILKILKDNRVKSSTFTGIKLLTNDKYAANIAKYFDGIKIGMESVNDFTLKRINKGYNKTEILKAMDNIKKYFHKNTHIGVNIIIDLVALSEEEVLKNYTILMDIKRDMIDNGFKYFFYSFHFLNIPHSHTHKMIDGDLIRINNDEQSITGKYFIREILKKGNIYVPREIWETLKQDYKRFDINGNEMKPDIDIISIEDMPFLFDRC